MAGRSFKQGIIAAGALAIAGAGMSFCPAAAQTASPSDYGALPTVSAAEISPDGNTIAQIQSIDGVRAVAFYDLTGEMNPIGVELGNVDARDLIWAGPDHALVMVSASETFSWGHGLESHEFWRWISINRNTGEFVYLFSGNRFNYYYGSGYFKSILPNDPTHILMGHMSPTGEYSLYRLDLTNGEEELFARGDNVNSKWFRKFAGTVGWVVDAVGHPAVRIDYSRQAEERRFFKPTGNGKDWEFASAIPEKEEDDIKLIAHGLAGAGHLIHGTMTEGGYRGLYVFDIDIGEIAEKVFNPQGYDISSVVVNPATASVIGVRYIDDFRRTHFIVPELNEIQKNLEKAIPGGIPQVTSWADDFSKFMVRVSYADHPDQYFLYDHKKKSLNMTAASYEALDGKVQAKKEKYDYAASDGLIIPGYLTVPAGAAKKNMPLIVLPHGGPWARDDQSFDWWAFFYAARGYLVYQPNFRGSDGYGEAFKEAANGEWGRRMQDDITEGVLKLIADGIADPDRICIVGASYGGYAALAGATLTPTLYACAVSVNGISSVPQLLADESGDEADNDYWKKRVGSRFDKEIMRGINPVHSVTQDTPPTLLIHSEHDILVRVGQSRTMRNALRSAGIENELIILKGEDHWLSTAPMRTEMLDQSIAFIDRHIGSRQ